MLTAQESEKFKRGLGKDYGKAVQAIVDAHGLKTRTGGIFKKSYISMVLQGERDAPVVEEALREVYTKNVTQIFKDVKDLGIEIPVE